MFFTFTSITPVDILIFFLFFLAFIVRWTLWGKRLSSSWKNPRPWARESVVTTAPDWLTAASSSHCAYPCSWREENTPHPVPPLQHHAVTGLVVIWEDVLSADFQIHKSLRSDEIEAAWKARRGDWHVWVALWARRCKLHANVPSFICLYVLDVCLSMCFHNSHALCFILPTYACICIRVNSPLVHTPETLHFYTLICEWVLKIKKQLDVNILPYYSPLVSLFLEVSEHT